MVEFNLGHTTINKITNEIKVNLEKDPHKSPYIHQATLKLNAVEAIKLRDQLKVAIEALVKQD